MICNSHHISERALQNEWAGHVFEASIDFYCTNYILPERMHVEGV